MNFPSRTRKQARWIAQQIKKRNPRKTKQISALYNGSFLDIRYGIEDLLKKSTGALFLHELERSADCYSLSLALYNIAEELDLSPTMYWVDGMQDREKTEPSKDHLKTQHSFISVKSGGENIIVDPFHSWLGEYKFRNGRFEMQSSDFLGNKTILRTFDFLEEPSREEIIAHTKFRKTEKGFRYAFSGTQKINKKNITVSLEVSEDSISSSFVRRIPEWSSQKDHSKFRRYELQRSLDYDLTKQAILSYDCLKEGFDPSNDENKNLKLSIDYSQVPQFRELLNEATSKLGRSTSIFKTRAGVPQLALFNLGGDNFGRGLSNTFTRYIEKISQNVQLEDLCSESAQLTIAYWAQRYDNDDNLLYSKPERLKVAKEAVQHLYDSAIENLQFKTAKDLQSLGVEAETMNLDEMRRYNYREDNSPLRIISLFADDEYNSKHFVHDTIDKLLFIQDSEPKISSPEQIHKYTQLRVFDTLFVSQTVTPLHLPGYKMSLRKLI